MQGGFHIFVPGQNTADADGRSAGLGKLPAISPFSCTEIDSQRAIVQILAFNFECETDASVVKGLAEQVSCGWAVDAIGGNGDGCKECLVPKRESNPEVIGEVQRPCATGKVFGPSRQGQAHQLRIKIASHYEMQRGSIGVFAKILAKGPKYHVPPDRRREVWCWYLKHPLKRIKSPSGQTAAAQLVAREPVLVDKRHAQSGAGGRYGRRCSRRARADDDNVMRRPMRRCRGGHSTVTLVPTGTREYRSITCSLIMRTHPLDTDLPIELGEVVPWIALNV